jgi:hypothetical protein
MKQFDLMFQTMLAELSQRSLDGSFATEFPSTGRFVPVTVKERTYWYFDTPSEDGGQKRRYVGPKDDAEITRRVEAFNEIKNDIRSRRQLVRSLIRAGMPAPDFFSGEIVAAMEEAGLFRLRAVLIGTVAFQTYSGVLGVRLPASSMMTGDADFAQDYAISAEVEDSIPPILDVLKAVDESFRPVPHQAHPIRSTAFENAKHYKVEFLTGNRGSDDYIGKASEMPALGGASAEPLRFLDFLIREPIRTVMLHRTGIPVRVPAPARYAVHKMIVASRRAQDSSGILKRDKDVRQAALLFEAMAETRRMDELAEAWSDAWGRGAAWQDAMNLGWSYMADKEKAALVAALSAGMRLIGEDVEANGLGALASSRHALWK